MSNWELSLPLLEQAVDRLVVLETATSTNAEIKNLLNDEGVVAVVTDHQTEGRGRLGRQWVSKPGESIALSLAVPWSADDHKISGSWVPLIAGACLVEVLREQGVADASLKWPNDVIVGQMKLAGILCEWDPTGSMIVGVGLNVDFRVDEPPSPRATALFHHISTREKVVDSVLAGLVVAFRAWRDDAHKGVAADNVLRVSSVMGTLGRVVEVLEPSGERWRGSARGLDQSGHLLVAPHDFSQLRVVVASDIEHLYQ